MDFEKKVVELDVNDILPNRFQPRIKFNEDSINELCDSIREHGVIQPIVVRKMGDKFEIIAGERRFKASLLAGKTSIPAVITELNDKDSAEVALIENVQRRDLTPIEEAISYKKILDMGYLTQDDLALKLGKTQSTIANKLRLLNLTEDVQEALLEEKISERHARSLLKLTNPAQQREMLDKILNERLTVRKTEDAINKLLNGENIFDDRNLNNKIEDLNKISNINFNDNEIPNTNEKIESNQNDSLSNSDEQINQNNNFINFKDSSIQNDYDNMNYSNINNNFNVPNINNEEINDYSSPKNIYNDTDNYNFSNDKQLDNKNVYNDLNQNINTFNKEEINEAVPTFDDNDFQIPAIPIESEEKTEEPVVIIEEEPTMNNNNQNNNLNNQNINNSNEFNPFDMMNNIPNNDFNIPTSTIQDSPEMNNDFKNNYESKSNNIEEPNINIPNNNNSINPGFMDIDKIKNEAVDINSILNNNNDLSNDDSSSNNNFFTPINNMENNYNMNQNNNEQNNIFTTNGPVLRPSDPIKITNFEEEEEIKPGKFFNLPFEEEEDKNQEVRLDSNPFEFNVNGDISNMRLNTEGHPKLKTLDDISQFKEPEVVNNSQIPSMMNQNNNFNNQNINPVNQFGLPIQENYNMHVTPTTTTIPPMEQNITSYMGNNNIMSSQLPSNKDMNLAMDAIKECVNKIKGLGFNVNTEDFDFENMYQIMFRIEK